MELIDEAKLMLYLPSSSFPYLASFLLRLSHGLPNFGKFWILAPHFALASLNFRLEFLLRGRIESVNGEW